MGWFKDFTDPQTLLDPTFNGENIIPKNNVNWPELDDPEINQAMNEAKLLTDPAERTKAWADIDKMIIEQAPTVHWIWDKDAEHPVVQRQGRDRRGQRHLGLRVHVAQVARSGGAPPHGGAPRPCHRRQATMAAYIIRRSPG